MISHCSTTTAGVSRNGKAKSRSSWKGVDCGFTLTRRGSCRRARRLDFWVSICCPAGDGDCRRTTCGASETGCAECATAGGRGRSPGTKSNGACGRGSPMPNMQIPGACASPSFAVGGSIRRGSLTHPLARVAWRFLEQQPEEPALREPQREHHREPEQQQRVPCGPHARGPEPAASRRRRVSDERPGRVMMSETAPRLLLRETEEARRISAMFRAFCGGVVVGSPRVVCHASPGSGRAVPPQSQVSAWRPHPGDRAGLKHPRPPVAERCRQLAHSRRSVFFLAAQSRRYKLIRL